MVSSSILFDKESSFEWVSRARLNLYSSIIILVDENTEEHCLPPLDKVLKKLEIPYHLIKIQSGEKEKQLVTCVKIWEEMTLHQVKRNALFINLGGGVIGDMGGFCASAYKRGISFINIPTTLLAQVDASVGGKLGIDFHGFKNHIGFFKDPLNVILNVTFLNTLPKHELLSGFAEIIKHCLIKDKDAFLELNNNNFPHLDFLKWIEHSIDIKTKIVIADPYEKNQRKLLNFGHTIGHAVETWYLNNKLPMLHGNAVALGMICETFLSVKKLGLSDNEATQIYNYILSLYPKVDIDSKFYKEIATNTLQDKKNNIDGIESVLLRAIGKAEYNCPITIEEVVEALVFYMKLA